MGARIACLAAAGFLIVLAIGAASSLPSRTGGQPTGPPGLVGDGVADNSDALQRAIDAGTGGVHFPKGTFRITRTLVVDLDKVGYTSLTADGTAMLKMDGPGPAIRFVGTHEGTAA